MPASNRPRVTIVMTARERHSLTEGVIDGIVSETPQPYRFMYLDCASPSWLRDTLDARAAEWNVDVVRFDEPLWPQEARQRVVERITTDYAVFIDNDVTVEAGWLEALVACADETHAGIVAPLYLLGDGVRPARIHMAGGRIVRTELPGGVLLEESHQLADADPRQARLARAPCDFGEFHCMLVRTALLRDDVLDPAIRCVHEHIDTALSVAQRGHAVYLEPAARVTYLGLAEYMLDDLAFLRERWSPEEADASIAAFCRKWRAIDDERAFRDVRNFVREHGAKVDPLKAGARLRGATAMTRDEHRQTRSGLIDLATECGYDTRELALLSNCYQLAHVLADGGYRPCGRPFIDHLVGTASVLVRYGFRVDIVAAALLHAAYTHAPPHAGEPRAAVDAIGGWLGGRGSAIEARVRAYTHRESTVGSEPSIHLPTASLQEGEVVAIVAANEIDLHLSGELRYSGRGDVLSATRLEEVREVCRVLGVEGLYRTLRHACDNFEHANGALVTRIPASYRFAEDRRSMLPMTNNVLKAAEGLAGGR